MVQRRHLVPPDDIASVSGRTLGEPIAVAAAATAAGQGAVAAPPAIPAIGLCGVPRRLLGQLSRRRICFGWRVRRRRRRISI